MTSCRDGEGEDSSETRSKHQKKTSKGRKHVSFPPDGQMVSSFVEDRDVDRDADSGLRLDEVMDAYQQSCRRHQVQPRDSILDLLQRGECVGGSMQRLDLEGERLELRCCEALEAVLQSLRFHFINLRAAQLEENGAASLLEMILFYESTTHLDMSDIDGMGTSAWRALAHLIKKSARLSRLDLCNVSLVDAPVQFLSRALTASRITVLHLDNTKLSGRPLFTLAGTLKTNRYLRELRLTSNHLNSFQDALQLGDLLRYNSTLETLEISNNLVADSGLEELCEGLSRQTGGLKVLLLNNNHITERGMGHLAKVLPALKVLQVLDLGENLLGNKGVQVIREPLMANSSLLQLGLARTGISCEGVVALAEVLAESRHICGLDLRQNPVRLGGLMALNLVLRINRSLASLQVDAFPEQQDQFLMETQTRLQSEIVQRCLVNAHRLPLTTETPET